MNSTKLILLLLLLSLTLTLSGTDLSGIHKVYVLPMAHGLEQYLANALTNDHVFVIVTDPKLADAVLTDHVGAGLQQQLDAMLAPPPTEKKTVHKEGEVTDAAMLAEGANQAVSPATYSSLGRAHGTVFLVQTKSRQVLWSRYELPRDATSRELDRIASAIVSRLRKDMGLKK